MPFLASGVLGIWAAVRWGGRVWPSPLKPRGSMGCDVISASRFSVNRQFGGIWQKKKGKLKLFLWEKWVFSRDLGNRTLKREQELHKYMSGRLRLCPSVTQAHSDFVKVKGWHQWEKRSLALKCLSVESHCFNSDCSPLYPEHSCHPGISFIVILGIIFASPTSSLLFSCSLCLHLLSGWCFFLFVSKIFFYLKRTFYLNLFLFYSRIVGLCWLSVNLFFNINLFILIRG